MRIGTVSQTAFASIPLLDNEQEANLGMTRSRQIWQHLHEQGFINEIGEVLGMWRPQESGFSLHLPDEFTVYETALISTVSSCRIESVVKSKKARVHRKFNGNLYLSPEFEEFWEKITKRTTYRVEYDSDQLITKCVKRIQATPEIPPIHIAITRAGVELTRGGAQTSVMARRESEIVGAQPLPDTHTQLPVGDMQSAADTPSVLHCAQLASHLAHTLGTVIVRAGEQGAWIAQRSIRGMENAMHIPTIPVHPVDTNGAGDCHTGTLAALLLEDMDLYEALHRANIAAALATEHKGPAICPAREEVEHY